MSHTKTTHQHRCPPSLPPFIPTSLLVVAALPWSEEGTERALQNPVENLPLHPSPFFRHKAHGTPSCVVGADSTQSILFPHPINLVSSPNQSCFLTQSILFPHPINLLSSPNQSCFQPVGEEARTSPRRRGLEGRHSSGARGSSLLNVLAA